MSLIASSHTTLVLGLGATGLSVARFLQRQGRAFAVADSRSVPPNLEAFCAEFPNIPPQLGPLQGEFLSQFSQIILSPGIAREEPAVAEAIAKGVLVIGDIDLFVQEAAQQNAPVVAITGSNGKTTVTTLVGEMARACGLDVGVGGNLGVPALDLLSPSRPLYVLELSSFQLESTRKLGAAVACILNLSDDHLDRYGAMPAYHRAKQRIFFGAKQLVANKDDALTQAPLAEGVRCVQFGLAAPDLKDYGLLQEGADYFLAKGLTPLLNTRELKIRGRHNWANALAALALGEAVGLERAVMLHTLRTFNGLPHRCEFVGSKDGVEYFNDSKATNVGATLAAIAGMASRPQQLILILGGDGKGADFAPLVQACRGPQAVKGQEAAKGQEGAKGQEAGGPVKAVVTLGRDGPAIAQLLRPFLPVEEASSLDDVVQRAARLATAGDIVLLSPACASLDMFKSYEVRGAAFAACVAHL
ncbi:MAG: UDP-N-acetylmuramoyl-L-alanyl-D-glutamate synthetase [Pseudomonadota bacterium]|jgi:UDP-N-acetylmuramoylalanine--D-glutamate ligase